jgi:L-alanine-DL-glutamate epimerase-like enolase superfamily enzyme
MTADRRTNATVKSIQTARVSLEARPELTVHGARGSHRRSDFLLIRIIAEGPDGLAVEGFGEISATPGWSGEDGGSAQHFIDEILKPVLIGRPLAPVGSLEALMDRALTGNVFTKAGLSIALWDCWAKILDVPLAAALGGPYRSDVPIKMSLSGNGPELRRCFDAVAAAGVRSYKVKVGLGVRDDVARVAYTRELAGAEALIGVDANGGWSRAEAIAAISALREYRVAFVEQPCAPQDLAAMRETRALGVPVIADESVFTATDLVQVIRQDAADIVSIYVGKAGGPARAVEQAQLAAAFGLDCVIGSNGEFGIGAAAQLHVACAIRGLAETVPSDVIGALYYAEDILEVPLDTDGVRVRLGDGAGLGVRPRGDLMELFR